MAKHAELGPSGASRWMRCQGSVVLSADLPNPSTEFAAEGSVAHEIGYLCLRDGQDATYFIGKSMSHDGFTFTVSPEMASHVQTYVDYVRQQYGTPLYEQRLPIMHLTGEQDAHGTADAVIIHDRTLHVMDLKFGMGVKVMAEENEQLQIYALAALHQYEMVADFDTIVLHIIQPRLDHIDTWELPVTDLLEFAEEVRTAARWVAEAKTDLQEKHFVVGEKQCKFCPAKGNCKALASHVLNTVRDDFTDMTQPITDLNESRDLDLLSLGHLMAAVPLIEEFCKSIRARVERELLDGVAVPGFKLVEGRRGNRKWIDETLAETYLKSVLEDPYERKLISPTTAAKMLKDDPEFPLLVTQSEGKPSVAPASDKRPALSVGITADDFT